MIRFDTVPTVELSTRDGITDIFVWYDDDDRGRLWRAGDLAWLDYQVPFFRYYSGESDALGRAWRKIADRVDPFGR